MMMMMMTSSQVDSSPCPILSAKQVHRHARGKKENPPCNVFSFPQLLLQQIEKAAQIHRYHPDVPRPGRSHCSCCGEVEDEHVGDEVVGSGAGDARLPEQQL